MEAPSSVFNSVFGRRKSRASKTRKASQTSTTAQTARNHTPPSIRSPTSPIAEDAPPPRTPPPPPTTATNDVQSPPGLYASPTTPQKRLHARHSIASSVGELGLQLRRSRSTSLRSATGSHKRHASTASTMHSVSLSLSPDKVPPAAPLSASRPTLSIATFARNKAKSSDNVKPDAPLHHDKAPLSALDKPKTPFMAAMPLRNPPPQTAARSASTAGLAPAAPIAVPSGANPNLIFQHIHELASKRISTLDYLRKA